MPIIDTHLEKNIIIMKRGMGKGYAGIENFLFFNDKTRMLFGDAKGSMTKLVSEIKSMYTAKSEEHGAQCKGPRASSDKKMPFLSGDGSGIFISSQYISKPANISFLKQEYCNIVLVSVFQAQPNQNCNFRFIFSIKKVFTHIRKCYNFK